MGDKTGIQWTEATWNPLTGCTKISQGCANCYAERVALRLQRMGQPRAWSGDCRCETVDDQVVRRLGVRDAGRLLDGREWNEMPLGMAPLVIS